MTRKTARLVTTNLHELTEALINTRNDLIIEHFTNKDQQITELFIGDTPIGGSIRVMPADEFEHFNIYNVEINHNYSGEYVFKNINYKHVVYLLTQEEIL